MAAGRCTALLDGHLDTLDGARAADRPACPGLWRLRAMLADSLPLLLMAVLTGGGWWLVRKHPELRRPGPPSAQLHVPVRNDGLDP